MEVYVIASHPGVNLKKNSYLNLKRLYKFYILYMYPKNLDGIDTSKETCWSLSKVEV